jgi:hypothetical protein
MERFSCGSFGDGLHAAGICFWQSNWYRVTCYEMWVPILDPTGEGVNVNRESVLGDNIKLNVEGRDSKELEVKKHTLSQFWINTIGTKQTFSLY